MKLITAILNMKTILVLITVILLCSCAVGSQSIYNYPNAVVVDKKRNFKVQIRIKERNKYVLKWIEVPREEYINFELGDTIKPCYNTQ